jgi:hypothetical protein
MSKNHLIVAVLLAFVVAACAVPTEPVETSVVTQPPAVTEYPGPQEQVIQPTATSVYPGPPTGVEVETQEPVQVIAPEFQPAEGDEKLKRGTVHLNLEASEIVIMESFPVQVNVILRGSLPDPCHILRIVPPDPDRDNKIDLEVYSLVDPSQACITVIEPFEATVSLGSFSTGTYTILVNGVVLGEFDV